MLINVHPFLLAYIPEPHRTLQTTPCQRPKETFLDREGLVHLTGSSSYGTPCSGARSQLTGLKSFFYQNAGEGSQGAKIKIKLGGSWFCPHRLFHIIDFL